MLEIAFFLSVGLLVYLQLGYPLALLALRAMRGRRRPAAAPAEAALPSVSLIVTAHDEEGVISERVANALALDYPRDKLEVIVASDGSSDRTAELARTAGADRVMDLPRHGKIPSQDAAVEAARGEILAFSDANAMWHDRALRELVEPFANPEVGYVCGQVQLLRESGDNQEGLYWRLEMGLRGLESDVAGVTAGNGAIYAARRDSYMVLEPSRSHDGSFPFLFAKRGWRSLYAPGAIAEEHIVPEIGLEFARKRRVMQPFWDVVIRDGMFSPRGYPPLYAFQIFSNRFLRYLSPILHLIALGTSAALAPDSAFFAVALGAQLAVLVAAALAPLVPLAPFRIARYYVSVMAAVIIGGLWDRFRQGPLVSWEKAEGRDEGRGQGRDQGGSGMTEGAR